MLLPYPCLVPHHPLSGTPSSQAETLPASDIPSPASGIHHLYLVYPHLSGTHHPCLVHQPSLSATQPSLPGTPPVSGNPPHYWNPTPVCNPIICLEPRPIPCLVFHPVPHHHHLSCSTLPPLAIAAPTWPLTAPYLLIWLLPAYHLQLLLHATLITQATAI